MSASERRKIVLGSEEHRLWVGALVAKYPPGYVVRIDPPGRTLDQNARLHAMLWDIAKSGFTHEGRRYDIDDLKTLFVSAWMIETGRRSDVVQGFGGEAVQLRRSTTTFNKEELGELMDLVEAFAALRGIPLRETTP